MLLNYKTGKLPPNFYYLGIMLFAIGVWRIVVQDWMGIVFLVISLILIFIKSGVLIDTEKIRLKKYFGFLNIRNGKWEDISNLVNLKIISLQESQTMNVVSISHTQTIYIYKLLLLLPDREIELLSGEKDYVRIKASEISKALSTTIVDRTI